MKISKRKITILTIMTFSLVAVLSFLLVYHFRKTEGPSNSRTNLEYSSTNYVEINTSGNDFLEYEAIIDSGSGETTGYKVVGFTDDFTAKVSKLTTELYSLTIPAYHDSKPVVEIAIPVKDGSGNVFSYPTVRPADKPYETPWHANGIENTVGKVIVPKTVQKISPAAFNAFTEIREMELPFVGTERGNVKGSTYNKNTSSNCSFYAIFGTDEFAAMNDYNLNSITTGGKFNTLEEMIAARTATNDPDTYGTGQIKWRFNADNDTNSIFFNAPIHLTNVYITDEYCVADHAFFFSPSLKKIAIKWAEEVPSSQIMACGFGRRVFDTATALEMVILPQNLSSYGDGLFSHCLSLETVAVGGVETGEISYTELNSNYPKDGEGNFIKQVHLPLENPVGVVAGSDIKINEDTFEMCSSITNVVIPHNVTSIDAHAFDNCTSLINVRSSSKDYSVGNYCDLPQNLEKIGTLAFRNCTSLENITVPTNVKSIETAAFNRCTALKSLTLPFIGKERGNSNTVEALFGYVFGQYGNPEAGDTTASPDICTFQAVDGNPSESRVGEAANVARGQFYIPSSLKNVVISDETVVCSGAFMNCKSLVSLQITSFKENEKGYSTMTIGEGALGGCINLENLSIPFVGPNEFEPDENNLKPIMRDGRGADKYQLGWIFGPYEYRNTTRIVQGEAFTSSNPRIYYFPSNLQTVQLSHQTYVPSYSFWKTSMIRNVIIDNKTIASQREIFHGCSNLENLTVPFTGISRGLYTRNSGLMDSSTHYYGDYWYSDDYYLRNSLIWLFSNSSTDEHYRNAGITDWRDIYLGYIPMALKSVTITDETYFETHALNGFETLESVTIQKGENVDIAQMHIDEGIMANCGKITNLELPFIGRDYNPKHENTKAYTIGWLFGNKYAYNNCRTVYQGVNGGANYQIPMDLKTIAFDNYITTIADGAFRGISSLESVKSNSNISQLGNYAFANCTSLKEVVMPNAGYTVMGNYAFANCVGLSEISAFSPATVKKIGDGALMGTSIKEVDFSKYYYLGNRAFANCLQLTSVDMTAAGSNSGNTTGYVDYVGQGLFAGCTRLTDVKLKDIVGDGSKTVQFVSDNMFEGCSSLQDINLNGKLANGVPNGFLKDCINLRSYYQVAASDGSGNMIDKGLVLYPSQKEVTRIGEQAFKGCKSLTTFILPENLVSIGNAAFQNCTGLDSMRIPRTTTSIPLGTDANGVDNYTTGVFYGCDENKFYLEVFIPESKWPWGINWNCYFPVNIIGDQNENLFTYEYCKELKGYLITGLNFYDKSTNPTGVDFAPDNHLLLSGILKFPSTYNGLKVYGLTPECFKDYLVQAYEGSNLIGRHPFAEVESFILGENFVTIGKDALNFDPVGRSTYRSVFSQKTAVQAGNLGPKTCSCNADTPSLKHTGISGVHYDSEEEYIANGIVYYKEAWTYTGAGTDSTPVYTINAIEFTLDSTTFQYNLGKAIEPRIISIDVNNSYVKYPADNKDAFRRQGDDELYNLLYPDSATLDATFLAVQYINNINAGNARMELTSNNAKIKGKRTIGFTITKRRIDALNASMPDANYYGSLDGVTPLSAQDHLAAMFSMGKDNYNAYFKDVLAIPASINVSIAKKTYDGKPWENSLWTVGTNLFGLPDGFTFSGTLQTSRADAGHYWTNANVVQSQYLGSNDMYHCIDVNNPDLWITIQYMAGFKWSSKPVIKDSKGRNATNNFEVVVTGAVYIAPHQITESELKWPGVYNGSYHEIEYTGLEIIPVPTLVTEDGLTLDPKFKVRVSSEYKDPDHAIDPSETLYRSRIIACDTRNFVFVTYEFAQNKNLNYIDFKVVKARLTITMDVVDYLIGVNELEFSFDLANWVAYKDKYHISIKGLGYGSTLGGTVHTTSSKDHGGWENQSVAIYSSDGTDYRVEWSNAHPFIVTNASHDPVDITNFYEPILDIRVGIEWNRFDYDYTITDPTLSSPYVIKGVDKGMGIEVYEETPDMLNMRYGVDGYEHILDIIINNAGISQTIGDANFNKTFTYDLGSGAQKYSSYTIKNIINDTIKLDLSRDRFYPITQTINLSTVKGSYVVKNLTKEYDRQAVDPYANLVRKPVDFDPTKLIFAFYNRSDRTYAEPLGYAPSAIGNYKYTMSTLAGHSVWFNDEDEWPRKEVNKNQADFEITRRSIYIYVVDTIDPFDSKTYDGEPWRYNATNTSNVTGMVENLLDGDLLTGNFMSRDKEIGIYDGAVNGDFIIASSIPWSVSNAKLGDQSDNYRIVFKGKYEIKPKIADWDVEGVDVEYDGQYYSPKVTVNDPSYGYTIYYCESSTEPSIEYGDWSIYPPYKVEPGQYTIWVKLEAPYYMTSVKSCIINIKGKNIQCTIENQTVPYDGYEHGIDVEVTDPEYNYTIYYAILEDEMLDYTNVDPAKLNFRTVCPLFEDAGIYHYWVKVEAPNYQPTEITHVTLTIDNNSGKRQNIAIQDYEGFFDGKYHGPMFDLTNIDPNLKPEDLDISYYFGDGTVAEPKWYSGSLELVSGSMYHLPILHDATDDPVMVTVRSKVLGYALTQITVGVWIKKLQLHLEPVSYEGTFDNKYHTVYLQTIAGSGHTLEILEEDIQAKVPYIKYRYYFGTDKETAQYVDLSVRYSATPAISGNTSGFVSTPVRYINSRKTPYQIFINVSAPNCKDVYLHTGTVTINFNNNPTWSLKEEPVEIEYLARPVTLADMQFETVHDGQPILTYYAKANPSVPIAAPIDLGEYWVEAVYPATPNCAKMEARVDFTIVPRRLKIDYEKEHEYSGVEWVPEVFATTNTTDTVLIHPYLEAGSNGIDLGDHYFYIEMEVENKNYYIAPEDQRLMFTIIKRKLIVTFPDENGTKIHQYSIPPSKWTGTEADLKFDNLLPADQVKMVMETTGTAARRYTTNGTFTYDNGDYISNWTGSNLSSNAVNVLILDIYHLDDGGSNVPATYYDVEVHLTVRIALPKLDVTVDDPTEYNYDNTYHTLDITMNTRILNYTVKYWPLTEEEYNKLEDFDTLEDRDGFVDTFMQSEAGVYYVAYEINASNYDPYRGKARLIINKVALDIELKPFEQIYDAQQHQVEFDILNLEGIPTYPTAKHYYFSKKLMDERRITTDDIRKFFEDGCPTSSKKIYELWNAYTKNKMEDAGEYVAVILYDETLNWDRSFAIGEVEIQKRPLYFNYNGDNIYTDYKIYDGDKLIMPSMALLSYDESSSSGNKLPYSGLVKNHQILSTRMSTYSLRTSSADCRGDSYADIPDLDPVTRALWESPYQDKGDFEFHFFQVFYGASPTSVNTTGTNYADNYYPVVNKKNDVFQVQLTIKRAQMTRFEVTDSEYVYNGKDAMPTIRTHANGIGDFVYYYYPTDDSKNLLSTTPMAHATDVNDGYYQIYISVKPGRNYYQWNGESDSDPNNGAAALGSDYMGYHYKMAYVKVIPAEVRINWNQLEGYFDADENGNVLNHDPQPFFTTVTGRTEFMEYDITDSDGNPVHELKRAGSYGLSAHLAAYSDIVLKNYTFENADVTYTIKKRSYTISEVINDVWLHTNWTKDYTEDYFDSLKPGELPWLTNFKLLLSVRANANTAGQLYTSSQFTSTPKVTFVDPVTGDETDYTDCFQFNLDLLVNLTSNDLIVEGNDIDVVFDNTYHYPDIQVLSYANGYIISYYVMLVQEDGSYFNDWSIDDNPEKITYSEHLTEQITYGGKTYRTFFDTARYRVFYRVTIGANGEGGTDDIVYGNVDVHIRQAQPTLDFGNTGLDRIYNGVAPTLEELQKGISGHFNGRSDQLEFTYYELGGTTPLSQAPVDVGEYVVVVTSKADSDDGIVKNYAALNESYNFEITSREMTLTVNTDWEVDQNDLDNTSLLWSSKVNDNIYELANNSTGSTKYSVDVTNNTGLCSSDVLTFEIQSVNHIANRGRYFLKSSQTYDNDFTFNTYDPVEPFSVTWSVAYDDKGSGIVGNPDKTKNYVLKIDFNLVVHFPYIEVKVQDKTYAYDAKPKDLLGAGKNIEIIRPSSGYTILYGERNNAITDTTYERTEPGSYYAYFTIAATEYETYTGTTTLNIAYQKRDDLLEVKDSLNKVYDDVAYDSTTRPTVDWKVSAGEALPDPSTWKIEYFAAFKDGSLNYHKTGDAMESVVNAGDYIYRLTIPAGKLFSETVIEKPFTITRRTYVITAPNPNVDIIKAYDGKPWQYNVGSAANPDKFTFEKVPTNPDSGLVEGHRLLTGTLVTTGVDARTYSSVKTDQYRVQLQVNEPSDYMIVDKDGRDIDEDNYAVEYNMTVVIEKGIMTVETNVDANNQIPYTTEGFTFRAELKVPNGYQSKVMYSKDGGSSFSAECPKFYNIANNYQVIVKVEGIPNYYDFQKAYLFDIVQQQNTLNIDIQSRPYNGFAMDTPLIKTLDYQGYATSAPTPGVKVQWYNAITGEELTSAPKNVGKYRVKVSYPTNSKYLGVSATEEFEITPLEISVSWTDTELTYSASVQYPTLHLAATNNATDNMLEGTDYTLTYTYNDMTAITTPIAGKPFDVGSYIVKFALMPGTTNYVLDDGSLEAVEYFVIKQRHITISYNGKFDGVSDPNVLLDQSNGLKITGLPGNVTFIGGLKTTKNTSGSYNVKGTYPIGSNFDNLYTWSNTIAGRNKPYIEFKSGAPVTGESDLKNYVIELDIKMSITNGSLPYVVNPVDVYYDANTYSLDFKLNYDPAVPYTIEYSLDNVNWQSTPFEFIDVTDKHIFVRVKTVEYGETLLGQVGDADYDQFNVKIRPLTTTLTKPNDLVLDKVYDDKDVVVDGIIYNGPSSVNRSGNLTYTFYQKDEENAIWVEQPFARYAGKYKVVIGMKTTQNFIGTEGKNVGDPDGPIEIEFEISKREVNLNIGTVTKVYDGSPWYGRVSNIPGDITPNYTVSAVPGNPDSGLIANHYLKVGLYTRSKNVDGYTASHLDQKDSDFVLSDEFEVRCDTGTSVEVDRVKGSYELLVNADVHITQAEFDVEVRDFEGPYDGKVHTVEVIWHSEPGCPYEKLDDLVFFCYEDDAQGTYVDDDPGSTKTTSLWVKIVGENYKTKIISATITLHPQDTTITITDWEGKTAGQDKIYDGLPYDESSIKVTLPEGDTRTVTFKYYDMDNGGVELPSAPINAGNYKFIAHVDASDDGAFAAADSSPVQFRIAPQTVTVTWKPDKLVKDPDDNKDYYMLTFTGKSNMPTPSAIGKINDPVEDDTIDLEVELLTPAGVTDAISIGTYSCKAKIKDAQDQKNYVLENDTVNFKIGRQPGGIIVPGGDIPQPDEDGYNITFVSPFRDPEAGNNPYDYKKLLDQGKFYAKAIIETKEKTVVLMLTIDLKTGEIIGIHKDNLSGDPVGMVGDGLAADTEVSFTLEVPVQRDKDGKPILDKDGNRIPIITTTATPVTAILKDKLNMAWDSAGTTSDSSHTLNVNPTDLSTTPGGPENWPEIIVYDDYKNVHAYTGSEITFPITVAVTQGTVDKADDIILVEGVDYEIEWFNNIQPSKDGKMGSFVVTNTATGGYSFTIGDATTDTHEDDAGTFTILQSTPERLTLSESTIYKFEYIEQNFDDLTYSTKIYTNEERTALYDKHTIAEVAEMPLRLGHTYQGQTIEHLLRQFINDEEDIVIYSSDPTQTTPIFDKKDPNCDIEAAKKTIIATGMKIVLYEKGQAHDNAHQRDSIEVLLKGDVTGDGLINNNDITKLYKYINDLKSMINDSTDNTEYSASFQAALLTGQSPRVSNNDITALYKHINGVKTGVGDINDAYNPNKVTPSNP